MRKSISAGLLTLVAVSMFSVPASGAAEVVHRGPTSDIVLYDTCDSFPIRYDLGLPEYTDSWSADLYVIGPDGLEAGSGFVYGDGAGVGTEKVQLCDNPRPGRYEVRAEVEACDYDYNCTDYEVSNGSFRARLPRSVTSLVVRSGSRLSFTVAVKDERPRGMFPSGYTNVVLQKKHGGTWVRVATGTTNGRGVARMSLRNLAGPETFRALAVFDSYDSVANSVSRASTVR